MRNFTYLLLLFCFSVQAQVGVGTASPQTTLDIVGDPTDITVLDGVIAPRLTGDQLSLKVYGAAQTAAIVYVTAAAGTPLGQTVNVTQEGYYYFDGSVWIIIAPNSIDWKIAGNSNTDETTDYVGTSNDQDVNFKRNSLQSGLISDLNSSFGYNSMNPAKLIISTTYPTTGIHNTAVGHTSLFDNTTGHRNTAIGSGVLTLNTTGYQNSAMGRFTMHFNTTGYNNMAIGQEAAKWNSDGHDNAAIGFNALRQNGTGSFNVAIGRSAMATSSGTDVINNVGDNNIAIGAFTTLPVTTGNDQMVLGGGPTDTYPITRTVINGITNSSAGAPNTSGSAGVAGEMRVATKSGKKYLYVCIATNSWYRVELSTGF